MTTFHHIYDKFTRGLCQFSVQMYLLIVAIMLIALVKWTLACYDRFFVNQLAL